MFSDFVGSTALSARMDPEDLREFRNNPDDNFMIALFADLWLGQYAAFRHAIDSTQQK